MAAAVAAYLRQAWGEVPRIIVVEPEAAPALHDSIRAGHPVVAVGPVSNMGRLDCKEPSLIALAGLSRDADAFALISDDVAAAAMPIMERCGAATTPSGGAGAAAALGTGLGLTARDRLLCVLSEASV
jgi:diaminopropionate ammonia-lyase